MKKIALLVGVLIACISLQTTAQELIVENSKPMAFAIFNWIDGSTHDFGELEQGIPAKHTFSFENNGKAALKITQVKTSCGCTATNYSKDFILPGEAGFIEVSYSAKSKGAFSKTVTVYANTESSTETLVIKGEVLASE